MRWRQGKRVLLVRTWQKFGGSGRQEGAGSYPLPHPTLSSGHFSRHLCHHWAKTRRTTSSQADQTKRWQGTRIISNQLTKTAGAGGSINIPLCVMTSPTQLYTGMLLRTSKWFNSNQVWVSSLYWLDQHMYIIPQGCVHYQLVTVAVLTDYTNTKEIENNLPHSLASLLCCLVLATLAAGRQGSKATECIFVWHPGGHTTCVLYASVVFFCV